MLKPFRTAFIALSACLLSATLPLAAQLPPAAPTIDPALQAKAEAGEAAAQMSVGEAWATAAGRAQECSVAANWYKKAADQKSIPALLHLATLYRDGCKTLPRDMAQAAANYRKAAELGDATAQGTLGSLYFMGQGVRQDYLEAYFWLDLATRTPSPKQEQWAGNRQMVGMHITVDDVEAAKDRVEVWLATHPHKAAQ